MPIFSRFNDPSTRLFRSKLAHAESNLEGAGQGLYTLKAILQDTIICEYFGSYVSINDDYTIGNLNGTVQICGLNFAGNVVCAAALINDPLMDYLCNVEPVWIEDKCYIRAITDIDPGEELYMAYGYKYWMSSKWPLQLFETARNNYENTSNTREWTNVRNQYN